MKFDKSTLYYINSKLNGERYPLFELAIWKNGLAYKNKDFSNTGCPIIKIAELNNGISENTLYTQEYSTDAFITKNDLLFSWSGNPKTSIDVFRYQLSEGWLNQHIFKVIENDKLILKDYLYYVLKFLKPYFTQIATNKQTTGLGHVTISDLKRMSLKIPPKEIQNYIVCILKTIDDKIELNNKINDNLAEQIHAIYKSWFVDYTPFNGKKPSDWSQTNIYTIADIIYGAPFSSKLFNENKEGMPIIRIRDLKDQEFKTYTTEVHKNGYLLQPADIVVGMDGEFQPYIWSNEKAWLNQRVCVFANKRPYGKAFLYYTIKPLLNHIEQTQSGTTVIHIGKKDFDKFKILLPNENVLNKFDKITHPLIQQIVVNNFQRFKLANLRDTLLPKLMSGEIDVSNINI